jgi:glycosyltransferase involved in cell wall biosynthesis
MYQPSVSVMMPVYNAERYVGKAIESILSQEFGDFELVIVNDGSTDGSLEILRDYAERDRRIYLTSRPNVGLVGSRNELLDAARSDLVACMDADDISLPDRLEKQVEYLREHPDCVLVGSRVIIIDPDGQPLQIMGQHLEHEAIDRALMNGEGQIIYNPSVMFRKRVAQQVGAYRREFDWAEDLDLFLRMAEVGRLANLPEPLLAYREHLSKTGHVHVQRQSTGARGALEAAHRRRGRAVPEWLARFEVRRPCVADLYRTWAWWALGSGYVATARKHAWASMTHAPLSVASWRLLYCAVRGY